MWVKEQASHWSRQVWTLERGDRQSRCLGEVPAPERRPWGVSEKGLGDSRRRFPVSPQSWRLPGAGPAATGQEEVPSRRALLHGYLGWGQDSLPFRFYLKRKIL